MEDMPFSHVAHYLPHMNLYCDGDHPLILATFTSILLKVHSIGFSPFLYCFLTPSLLGLER